MKIDVTHTRAVRGFNISISVGAEGGEIVQSVNATLDAELLADDNAGGADSYSKDFSQVGFAGPGESHTLTINVVDGSSEKTHTAVKNWMDSV